MTETKKVVDMKEPTPCQGTDLDWTTNKLVGVTKEKKKLKIQVKKPSLKVKLSKFQNKSKRTEVRLTDPVKMSAPQTSLKEKKVSCEHEGCDRKFSDRKQLRVHVQIYHSDARPYVCIVCSKAFKVYSYLWQHKQTHKERTFPCDLETCSKSFKSAKALNCHKKLHRIKKQI